MAQTKEEIKERKAKYYAENKEEIKERGAKYRAENTERIKERRDKYRVENKEGAKERNANYSAKLPDSRIRQILGIKDATPELMDMKREQIFIKREVKALKSLINQITKEQNEQE